MKHILTTAVFMLSVTVLSAQPVQPEKAAGTALYKKISAAEAKSMMEKGNSVIVDVRTEQEYDEGHIAQAILIPNESIANEKPVLLPDLHATILVYCRSGRRSQEAARKLVKLGYTNVYDFGGIISWPYGTVTEGQKR